MNNIVLVNIFRFFGLLLVQTLICSNINFMGGATKGFFYIISKINFINNNKKFNELALGQHNIFLNKKLLGNKILCSSLDDIEECINFLEKYKNKI